MFRSRLVGQLLFWALFVVLVSSSRALDNTHGVLTLRAWLGALGESHFWLAVLTAIAAIYPSLWVFTRYTYPRQPGLVLGQIILLGVLVAALRYLLEWQLLPLLGRPHEPSESSLASEIREHLLISCVFVMLAFVFKQLRDYQHREALLHEKNAIELAYLKAQLNPHFLFNSMNNLYGLALTEPESTPDAILKLAELMRYMLHESSADHVSLRQEVDYLHSYIALEKLRYEGAVHIEFVIEGNLDHVHIAPLLLICFVENAFKHGTVSNPDQPVQLHLVVQDSRLTFSVRNQIVAKNKDLAGGVGLTTVRRRLALLYPHQHQLTVTSSHGSYYCALALKVTSPAFGMLPASLTFA